jgi:pimeloyl-ACP methyl ester carboxylesterase
VSLETFLSTDFFELPGLLYTPTQPTSRVALFLHGSGDSSIFYSALRMNTLAEALTAQGIAFFPFNNRGAHFKKDLTHYLPDGTEEDIAMGTAYELIHECDKDIDGALRFLQKKGFTEFYLIGHSTGANKICVYEQYHPENVFSKYVLLGGGDDSGLFYQQLGAELFENTLKLCTTALDAGRGRELLPPGIVPFDYSYQSFFDTINPEGAYSIFPFYYFVHKPFHIKKQLFREYASLSRPTLVVYGADDPFTSVLVADAIEILRTHEGSAPYEYHVIDGADHGFHGEEVVLAETITSWL